MSNGRPCECSPPNSKSFPNRHAPIGNWHGALPSIEMLVGVDAEGGVDRGVQVGHADGLADDGHREFVGLAKICPVLRPPPASATLKLLL